MAASPAASSAVVLFARKHDIPVLSLGDLTCAVGPIGLFLGRLANFVNGELWGRPDGRALGHGVSRPAARCRAIRASSTRRRSKASCCSSCSACWCAPARCKRPGLIIGCFAIGYAVARSFCELFREPDPQLGFLWGGLTMGMVLSLPLLLFGIVLIVIALRRPPLNVAPAAQ